MTVGQPSQQNLHEFEVTSSADVAKDVPELVHEPCAEVLCDVEPGDTLHSLVGMATVHRCTEQRRANPSPELRGCMRDGYTPEDVNHVFGTISDECGVTLVCVWDYYDLIGPGGNSQFYVDTGTGTLRELIGDLWRWLNDDPFSPDSPQHPGPPTAWTGSTAEFCLDDLAWSDGQHNYAVRDDHRS